MTTFVLVGGFWIGAWAWRDVAARLEAAGHRVLLPELKGLGERQGEASPEVGLETHIGDVRAAIEAADLNDIVLVGHSGGAAIVNCVADRSPGRVAGIVFVDSGPVPDGQAIADFSGPTGREDMAKNAVDGWRLPLPPWGVLGEEAAGLDEETRAVFRANAADQPLRVATDPVKLTGGLREDMPRWAILTTIPLAAVREMISPDNPWFAPMGGPSWTLLQLPTGHWPMLSEPEKFADLLAAWPNAPVSAREAS
jgi:pimeloyl-ACP methyl ester carboxylesterase